MPAPEQSAVRNRLLSLMSAEDFARLSPHLQPAKLPKGYVVTEPDKLIEDMFFFDSGLGSILAVSPQGDQVEAGLFGRDGVTPVEPVLGADRSINRIVVQLADDSWRIGRRELAAAMEASPTLAGLLTRYALTLLNQTAYTALSNAVQPVDERLARWLLMCDDRSGGHEMALTHDFLAVMLAVRRPSVTTSLHVLEGNGFIRAERGLITIRNRAGLEQFASESYGKPEAEYRRLVGEMSEMLMPRFFFDTSAYGVEVRDSEGSELERDEEISELAMDVLAEMVHPGRHPAEYGEFFVLVRDDAGRIVYRAALTIVGEWVTPPPGGGGGEPAAAGRRAGRGKGRSCLPRPLAP